MWLIRLAWKNLWRNRSRTFITTSAVAFATVISIVTSSLQKGIFDNLVDNIVSSFSGYMQIHRKGYQDEQVLDNSFARSSALEQKILADGNIIAAAPRIESFALISSGEKTKGCIVLGIDPGYEKAITGLDRKIIEGGYPALHSKEVMIGEGLSQRLSVRTGDTIILIGQGYHGATAAGKYRVGALMKLGSPQLNERLLVMPLPAAQELFSADSMLTAYIISLREGSELDLTAKRMRNVAGAKYEVLTWEQIMPEVKQHIEADTRDMKVVAFILYVLISFGIFSTLLIMMVERRFETGMLLALGMSKFRLQILMMLESLITVMLGSLVGILLSIPPVLYLHSHPMHLSGETAKAYERFGFEPIFPTAIDPMIFIEQGLVVFVIGLILSMYPVYKVARLNAVKAMKK